MPYKYIGRTTDFIGKTLWEIVGNLKGYGVGRIVRRNRFERYPEPSYMKILKVEPLCAPEVQDIDHVRKVRVLVERTFRGKTFPQPIMIESASYKTDYKLIPKDEEEAYCRKVDQKSGKVYPKTMDFPPLLRELITREANAKGEKLTDEPKLEIVYNKKNFGKYRVAEDGETPNVDLDMGLGKTPYPSLYDNIKLST